MRSCSHIASETLYSHSLSCRLSMFVTLRNKLSSSPKIGSGSILLLIVNRYRELTIDKICGILGVSAAYFSTTFKKETGKTFIAYLTDYRMEQAVQRLIEGDDKTYVIAAQVGYADPAYFSYVFKKRFGVSPSRYRSERR